MAVYSLSAVRPGSPQSHVGPVERRLLRPKTSNRNAGTMEIKIIIAAIPAVETVPLRAVPAESTNPFAATRVELTRIPIACSVTASNAGRNQPAPSPSTRHPVARTPIPKRIERETSLAFPASSLLGRARKVIPKALTKQAEARAAVNASRDPATGNITRARLGVVPNPASSA